jgi:hypothetical protein
MSQLDTTFDDVDADLDALLNQVGSSSSCRLQTWILQAAQVLPQLAGSLHSAAPAAATVLPADSFKTDMLMLNRHSCTPDWIAAMSITLSSYSACLVQQQTQSTPFCSLFTSRCTPV